VASLPALLDPKIQLFKFFSAEAYPRPMGLSFEDLMRPPMVFRSPTLFHLSKLHLLLYLENSDGWM
jgi:hypothetical protein